MSSAVVHKAKRPSIPLVLWCGISFWCGCCLFSYGFGVPKDYLIIGVLVFLIVVVSIILLVFVRNAQNPVVVYCLLFGLLGGFVWNVECLSIDNQHALLDSKQNEKVLIRIEEDINQGLYSSYALAQIFDINTRESLGFVSLNLNEDSYGFGSEFQSALTYSWPREEVKLRYYQQGIAGFATLTEIDLASSSPLGFLASTRSNYVNEIDNLVNQGSVSSEAGALLQGLIVGDRTQLFSLGIYQEVKVLGLAHIVAVSGAHLVIVMSFLSLIVRNVPLSLRIKIGIQLAILGLYLCIVGFPISCVRAACMSALSIISVGGIRRSHALSALGVVVIVIITFIPTSAFSLSFLLSVCSTLGILLFMPLLLSWVSCSSSFLRSLVVEPCAMTLAALLTTLPFTISAFSLISLIAPVSNVLATPFVSFLCIVGLLSFIFLPCGFLGILLLKFALLVSELFCIGCSFLSAVPFASVPLFIPELPLFIVFLLVVILLWCVWPDSLPISASKLAGILFLICLLTLFPRSGNSIAMLDVGQGDAFLIQSNSQTILVDTGQSEKKLFAALSRQGCTHLDAVIITHADNDHAGCLSALKGVVDCERVILSEGTNDIQTEKTQSLVDDAESLVGASNVYYVNAGDVIQISNMHIEVIWPKKLQEEGGNQDSICFLLNIDPDGDADPDWSALFCGDAEAQILEKILDDNKTISRIDILKVSHHGAKAALTNELAERLHPKISLVSVGEENRYGHPSMEVLNSLSAVNSTLYRTDYDGDVVCSFTDKEIKVKTLR